MKTIFELGVFTGLKEIVKNESFLALYRGNGAQMVRIFPYASVQFFSFELYKKVKKVFIILNFSLIYDYFLSTFYQL